LCNPEKTFTESSHGHHYERSGSDEKTGVEMSVFIVEFDYPRNKVITEMLRGIDMGDFRILTMFNKKLFIKKFWSRKFMINDFFVSDYDTWVIDRDKEKWFYPK